MNFLTATTLYPLMDIKLLQLLAPDLPSNKQVNLT